MIENTTTGALESFNFEQLQKHVPELQKFNFPIDTYQFDPPMDSSDMEPDMWRKLVCIIHENYNRYQGFVILHGTDTMAYTASALSFMLEGLDKPVIRFCEWDVAITLNRLNNLIGTVPVNQTESLATTQAIAAAHIKRNAQALIAQMTNFLTTCKQQSAKMQRIKLNSFVGKSVLRYLPAIMLVKKEDRGEVVETKLPSGLEQLIGQRSCTKIRENMERTVEGSGWENVSIESQRMVAGKLERLIATSDLNERVKENMKKLMVRNETWLNVKEG